jgi:hypothetical protein
MAFLRPARMVGRRIGRRRGASKKWERNSGCRYSHGIMATKTPKRASKSVKKTMTKKTSAGAAKGRRVVKKAKKQTSAGRKKVARGARNLAKA